MGTRADFYTGIGKDSEWLGSITHDGYPDKATGPNTVFTSGILKARTRKKFLGMVANLVTNPETGCPPSAGWPWDWKDSCKTDWVYAWHEDGVWAVQPMRNAGWHPVTDLMNGMFPSDLPEGIPFEAPDVSAHPPSGGPSGFMMLDRF